MIGEVCRFYGWTPDQCLQMPAVRFFAMLEASRILDAHEKIEAVDIAYTAVCTVKWYEMLRGKYEAIVEAGRTVSMQEDKPVVNRPGLAGKEAGEFILGLFAAKRGMA